MPYKKVKKDDEWCVFKEGDDGTGDSLGCHKKESDADDQIAAINAKEKKDALGPVATIGAFFSRIGTLAQEFATSLNGGAQPIDLNVQNPAAAIPTPEVAAAHREAAALRAVSLGVLYEQVYQQAYEIYQDAYMVDMYVENDGAVYALLGSNGLLYRSPVSIDGSRATLSEDWQEVITEYKPAPGGDESDRMLPRSRTRIMRLADGKVRYFSMSCSAVLNRVGEIDSTKLFDSFIAHATKTGEYPIRQFFHAGECFRVGQTDWIGRDGFVLLTSGIYDDTDIARAEIAALEREPEYWGVSIGYDVTEPPTMVEVAEGIRLPMYNEGIMREESTLPEHLAAALFTRTAQEVKRMLNATQYAELVRLFGGDEEAAKKYLAENPDRVNSAIATGRMIARAGASSTAEAAPAAAATVLNPAATAQPDPEVDEDEEEEEGDDGATEARAEGDTAAADEAGDPIGVDDEVIALVAGHVIASPEMQKMFKQIEEMAETTRLVSETASGFHIQTENTFALIADRLAAIETGEDHKREAYQRDMPRRAARAITYRPRAQEGAALDLRTVPTEMAEGAAATLATLPD